MGDTTYNHVYGNATTGDITNAMRVQAAGVSKCNSQYTALKSEGTFTAHFCQKLI